MIFNLKSHKNQCRWRVKKSQLKHMATKSKICEFKVTQKSTLEVLKKASNDLNNCNVQSNNVSDVR